MNKVLMFLLLGFFLISFANAGSITYSVYEGIIENDGSLTESSIIVNEINMIGYECLDNTCMTLSSEVYNNYSNSNEIRIDFPSEKKKYLFYFYKDGFIGWESDILFLGDGNYDTDIYLSKKRTGYAPIHNMSVVNSVYLNQPVMINLETLIDADTYSAIVDNSKTGLNHNEDVETLVTLDIFDANGDLVYEEDVTLFIEYSDLEKIGFNYTFGSVGIYSINLTTSLPDSKIINASEQKAGAVIRVITEGKTDYSYTNLDGFVMNHLQPKINDTVSFSVDYFSGYVNEFSSVLPQNTSLDVILYLNGTVYDAFDSVLVDSEGVYAFNYTFPASGAWKMLVEGNPNPGIGSESFSDVLFLEFPIVAEDNNETRNETEADWRYFAEVNNLAYTPEVNLSDDFVVRFDYLFYGKDGLGNLTDVNGTLFFEIFRNDAFYFDKSYDFASNGWFNYEYDFMYSGNYTIDFELCPVIAGECEEWSLDFTINGDSDDKDDNKDQKKKRSGGSRNDDEEELYLTVNSGLTFLELGDDFGNDVPSILWIVLLLLACILMLIAILLVKLEKEDEKKKGLY